MNQVKVQDSAMSTMSWEMPRSKTIILVPHRGESGYREWERWFEKLIKPPGTLWREQRGLSLTTNRTGLVAQALETDAEYFLFLDDDVMGPDTALLTLLSHKAPIVSGLYMAKKRQEEMCLAAWIKRAANGYAPIAPVQPVRVVQVDAVGLGLCLIHRSIFERVPQPWFTWEWEGPSEDFSFFIKVAETIGVKPLVDMQLKLWHIGTYKVFVDGAFTTLEI